MNPPATVPRWRLSILVVTAVLLVGWLVWLGILAFTAGQPVVLHRPQFLVADLHVVARVDALDQPVTVLEVAWAREVQQAPAPGTRLQVVNLEECRDAGWQGPGEYILPLEAAGEDFRVPGIPPSPGYSPRGGRPRIYPLTPATREQLRQLPRP